MWSDDKRGKPSSYLISLLVLKAYESAGQSTRPIELVYTLYFHINVILDHGYLHFLSI